VRCGRGCSDCCYALFDLSLVEALYLNHHFNRLFDGAARNLVLERADEADRQVHRLKKAVFQASQQGVPAAQILADVARQRLRCPLLNAKDLCDLYDHRPLTCRLYGLPLNIGGESKTCGKAGFTPGKPYPTVNMERIQERLAALSRELVASLGSCHDQMWDLLLPVSMALMTEFNEEFLGVEAEARSKPAPKPAPKPMAEACASCAQDSSACSSCESGGEAGGCGSKAFSITIGQAEKKPAKKAPAKKPATDKKAGTAKKAAGAEKAAPARKSGSAK
jgi:Fe-S-cluster containining protein